jgi:predicted nucleic acid-binding protein
MSARRYVATVSPNLGSSLLAPFREIPAERTVAERAGRIRRESGTRLPDALIAATAIEHRLGLSTRNGSDFELVRSLGLRGL